MGTAAGADELSLDRHDVGAGELEFEDAEFVIHIPALPRVRPPLSSKYRGSSPIKKSPAFLGPP